MFRLSMIKCVRPPNCTCICILGRSNLVSIVEYNSKLPGLYTGITIVDDLQWDISNLRVILY